MKRSYYPHTWALLKYINYRFNRLEKLQMATKQEVLDSISGLGTDLDADFAEISAKIDALQQAGGTVEASDLDDIKAAVDAARAKATSTLGGINPPTP